MTLTSLLVVLILQACGGGGQSAQGITIKGSDTQVNLLLRLGERYMALHPNTAISITGGGSGTGLAALLRGQTDLAASSRAITQPEQDRAKSSRIAPRSFVIALDGLALIVHSENPLSALSLEQAAQIFRGNIRRWDELGSDPKTITLYGRQGNSGTFIYFRDHVVQSDYSQAMYQMSGNAQIVEAVRHDMHGIGYVGLGYVVHPDGRVVEGIKILSLRVEGEAVSPLQADAIINGRYPLLRPLFQYTDGKPTGEVREFLRFILSPEGQKLVAEEGFYAVSNPYLRSNEESLSL